MKRKLLLALISLTCALCFVFNLAGCNPAANNQSGTQQETPDGQGSGGSDSEDNSEGQGSGQQGENSGDEKPDTHNYIFKCSQTEHWQVCTDCGEETAHTPHSVSDGVCPACGYVEKCTKGLKFWEIQEKEIIGYSVSKGTATDSHIFIPSFYNNLPVISIDYHAFANCTSLTSITIPDGVTSIGEGAFSGCKRLKEITISDGVTSIGGGAFDDTAYYNDNANWKNDILYLGNYLLDAKYTLSGSYQIAPITRLIADFAFANCTSLKEITIPDSVTSIGWFTFSGCTSLEKITIPDGVTSIGVRAFEDCTSLKEITIPNSVTSIGGWAFYNCTSLEKITIPDSVTSIGDNAFYECTSLKEITIPDNVTSIGDGAFLGCTSLEKITIPNSVTSIGYQAFSSCTSLEEITIPDSVTSIGSSAFYGCRGLTRVIFENTAGWKVSENSNMSNYEEINVENPEQNSENLKDKYSKYYWIRG